MPTLEQFQPEKLKALLPKLGEMTPKEKMELLDMLEQYDSLKEKDECKNKLVPFMKKIAPQYLIGPHHRKIAAVLEAVARGEKKRVIINIGPRHSKSETASYVFPGWFLGNFPEKKIIMASHTAELATNFGRRVRNMMDMPEYTDIFPDVALSADSKAAGRWDTNAGGQYFAIGVGGALAGRGGDLILIDDPISEQDAKSGSVQVFLDQWEWFQQGLMTRLMPGGAVVVLMTRWSTLDLTGQIINHMTKNPDADQWEIIEFPAILNEGEENEKPLWPEFWSLEELHKKRIAVGPVAWAAQYMQNPTAEGSQLLKREWWKHWDKEDPPDCVYTVMSLDAAQETKNRSDYSACTLWGVFYVDGDDGRPVEAVILLNAWHERLEFPELKKAMFAEYEKWQPDTLIVEKKSNGAALYQEMRRAGIPVTEFTPSKGQDKIARVNAVSDLLASGMVYAPTDRRWAQELITECAEFPLGAHDDLVDSMTAALLRIRQGGLIRLPSDQEDDDLPTLRRTGKRFY